MTGYATRLHEIRWQAFCTFTQPDVNGYPPAWYYLIRGWYSTIRQFEKRFRIAPKSLLWAMRLEQGELHKRWHVHVLLGGMTNNLVSLNTCYVLEGMWKRNTKGISEVRKWDPTLDGVTYALKFMGNQYEQAKFGNEASEVTLSPRVIRELRRQASSLACELYANRRIGQKCPPSTREIHQTKTPRSDTPVTAENKTDKVSA